MGRAESEDWRNADAVEMRRLKLGDGSLSGTSVLDSERIQREQVRRTDRQRTGSINNWPSKAGTYDSY